MKVKIGKYKNYLGPYQIADKIFFWQKKYPEDEFISNRWDYKIKDSFADWLANTKINSLCKLIDKFRKRNIKVRIDYYDTWSMDNTLAYIIAPMLKQLKETKHGSPFIDDEDVPENIRSINAKPKENDYDVDEYHHDRWNYVLNEMIWAFEQKNDDDAENQFYDYSESNDKMPWEDGYIPSEYDKAGHYQWQHRKDNGFKLFGKYYESLWD